MKKKCFRRQRWNPALGVAAFARLTAPRVPMDQAACTDLLVDLHSALATIEAGHGVRAHFDVVAQGINISLTLSEAGYAPDELETVKAAQDALVRMLRRAQATGRWGLDGAGIRAVRAGLALYAAQIEAATAADVLQCMQEVVRRLDANEVLC
jgi:hypothetical protein